MASITRQPETTITTVSNKSTLLQNAMRADALVSATSGVLAIAAAQPLADFMGAGTAPVYMIMGIIFIIHALLMFTGSSRFQTNKWWAWYGIESNSLYVVLSAIIVFADSFALATGGKWLVLIGADIVLVLAIAQFIGLRRMKQS